MGDTIKRMSQNWVYLLVIVLFSLLGMKAMFHPGLFTAHDIWHQIVRFYYYSQAVNDGQLPPYWIGQLANRFGYPLFFFSYHLPWLIGVLLLKVGFDFFNSVKLLFFLSYIFSGITMYFFVMNLLRNRLAALTSAVLYLWLPYHFMIIFVGASMGVAFVFTFLPLIFLGIHLIGKKSKFGIPILSIALSGVILSHTMHLVFLLPVILIFTLWELTSNRRKINFLKNISLGLLLAILISAFYLIPAFYYSNFTKVHTESGFSELYKRNFVNFSQLLYSKWGFGPIINNAKDAETSFQLGIAQWISIILLIITIATIKLSKTYFTLSFFTLSAFGICVILMLDYSKLVWAILVKFVSVDFPFRLLLPSAFVATVCAGIVIANAQKKLQILLAAFLLLVATYTNRNHLNVNLYTDYPISTYLDSELAITTNTFNEYLPTNANPKLLNKPWNEIIGENLSVSNAKQTTNSLSFDINLEERQNVLVGQFYFPGQTLYLDNKISQFEIDKEGRINFIAPQDLHTVMVKYEETPLIKLSKILTITGIVILLFLLFRKNLQKKFALN